MALKKDEKHLIELIVSGKDYPEAYSTVYPDSKKTKRTISACICRMLKRQDIQKYKAECERKIQEERTKIKDEVAEIIREKRRESEYLRKGGRTFGHRTLYLPV